MAQTAGTITFTVRGLWRLRFFLFLVKAVVVVMNIANSLGRRSGKPGKTVLDFVVKCKAGEL